MNSFFSHWLFANGSRTGSWFRTLGFVAVAGLFQMQGFGAIPTHSVVISNALRSAPYGIAWVVQDSAAFVINTGTDYVPESYVPGTAAPDDSYHLCKFSRNGVKIVFEWGRVGNNVVGRITADQPADLDLALSSGWPGWSSKFKGTPEGAAAIAPVSGGEIEWILKTSPEPKSSSASVVTVSLSPDKPLRLVAGIDRLPAFASVDETLEAARQRYHDNRPQASGDWGDFVGAIADNMNNSRLYSNDDHMIAHTVSRGWAKTPNGSPYFCWDSFFNANLAVIDDPSTARNTVRAILSWQSPEGLVPNYAHWREGSSVNRSQPPVGSWCVWKMHQRYPNDLDFLGEVYPRLVLWHDWWPKYRNAKKDGLLEWGSNDGVFQGAQYETGWDDNLHYLSAVMTGNTMDCYSVDLSSMWAMDAHYLALLAGALGKADDAQRFRKEEAEMIRRINDKLWNTDLNTYCSRFWEDGDVVFAVPQSAFGNGFEGEYFKDEELKLSAGVRSAERLAFNYQGKSPMEGVGPESWSARWRGALTAPETATYRFAGSADDGLRVDVDGKRVIDGWAVRFNGEKIADIKLQKGQTVPIVVEYFQRKDGARMRVSIDQLMPSHGAFLTRLTPMNFYPLSAGAASEDRARAALSILTDPHKFWGKYLLPTLAYDDPRWREQQYWKGNIWGPANYIAWPGIRRYASPEEVEEYAARSVRLFMREWERLGVCSENYLSTDGTHGRDPHYTWGALLNLIGLESIVDVDDDGKIVLNGVQNKTVTLKNIPLLGRVYDVKTSPGAAVLFRDGVIVLTAKGKVIRAKID